MGHQDIIVIFYKTRFSRHRLEMIRRDTLRGYILEEVLAYLIRNAGYELLVDARQDSRELVRGRAGLAVRGRGADHQADVLGELGWIPAFTYPLRLFAEAKFRKAKTGIPTVRNAIGVVLDVNQNNMPNQKDSRPAQKYHYAYVIFSTSGFSSEAQAMALAHQVSLVDLSGPEYNRLRNEIDSAARNIPDQILGKPNLIPNLRYALRKKLHTLPDSVRELPAEESIDPSLARRLGRLAEPAIGVAREYGELFVAMANGPYMLLLKSRAPKNFLRYARKNPKHKVVIHWSTEYNQAGTWVVQPTEDDLSYTLEFRLPEALYHWIFDAGTDVSDRARSIKRRFFSNITIYRREKKGDRIFKLEYDPSVAPRHAYPAGPQYS